MGRGRRKESMCGKSALTQAALELRENWPKKKKPQPKENSLRNHQPAVCVSNDYFRRAAENGGRQRRSWRKGGRETMEETMGWKCWRRAGVWRGAVEPGPYRLPGRERREGKHCSKSSTPDLSPQFNNNRVKAACIVLPRNKVRGFTLHLPCSHVVYKSRIHPLSTI